METIGDSYMVASGVPAANDIHASEIALMSLELMNTVADMPIPHFPHETFRLRIGIHSGKVSMDRWVKINIRLDVEPSERGLLFNRNWFDSLNAKKKKIYITNKRKCGPFRKMTKIGMLAVTTVKNIKITKYIKIFFDEELGICDTKKACIDNSYYCWKNVTMTCLARNEFL